MSGVELASEIAAAIAEAGSDVGSGTPLVGQIVRISGADETTYPPTAGSETSYDCTLVLSEYSAMDRDGTNITTRDVKVLIASDAETDPRNGDRLEVSGNTYELVNVIPVMPGGTVLLWRCQARGQNG